MKRSKLALFLIIPLLTVAIGGSYRLYLFATHNFHEVVPGELYRAARPTKENLAYYQQRYGIRSVLNLRGANPDKGWYRDEAAQTKQLGMQMIDVPLNSKHELSQKEMHQLISLMRDAPKPILVHCQAGADRSGLASALYLMAIKQVASDDADNQLSLRYGHLPFSFSKAYAMDRSFIAYSTQHETLTRIAQNNAAED